MQFAGGNIKIDVFTFYQEKIKVVESFKYLGIVINRKLSFRGYVVEEDEQDTERIQLVRAIERHALLQRENAVVSHSNANDDVLLRDLVISPGTRGEQKENKTGPKTIPFSDNESIPLSIWEQPTD